MSLEDLTLTEVHCCECGKPIPSIPPWLANAQVKFECEECRSRHPRMPGMDLETRRSPYGESDELAEMGETAGESTEEEADEETEEQDDYSE